MVLLKDMKRHITKEAKLVDAAAGAPVDICCWHTEAITKAHLIKPQSYYNRLKVALAAVIAGSRQENFPHSCRFLIDAQL